MTNAKTLGAVEREREREREREPYSTEHGICKLGRQTLQRKLHKMV